MTMNKSLLIGIYLLITTFLTVGPSLAQGPLPSGVTSGHVPGEIIVKFQPHVGSPGAQGSLRAEGLQALEVSPNSGAMRVQVEPGREADTIAELMGRGDVEFATLNYRIEALESPDDADFSLQWALQQINAPEAWNIHTGTGNVIIAVIDSGVDLDHPDLQANIVSGWDFVNDDSQPDDDFGHGTHVAGIAAAVGNNGQGIAGVSWGAKIMPLKILDRWGSGNTHDLSQAIYYAADHGAKIINLSLGARYSSWPCDWLEVEDALNYTVNRGVLVVAAAGNDGQYGINCPGAYDQVMAVGSTTSSDTRSYFSNFGPRLDIVAPGSYIYSTYPGGSYYSLSGTSMATPHVAGLAALIWSFVPSFTDTEVREIIQSTAADLGSIGWDQEYGHGRINAAYALGLQVPQSTNIYLPEDGVSAFSTEITVPIETISPNVIAWTATISPEVPWLEFATSNTGTVSAGSPSAVTLRGTAQSAYDEDSVWVIITGTTTAGKIVLPATTKVQLWTHQYHLPLILKNSVP